MKNTFKAGFAVAAAAFVLAGCAGNKPVSGPIAEQAPEWVNKGSGAFKDGQNMGAFYGVGILSGVQNRALAVDAADNRARAEIAKIMNTYVTLLNKDYMASTTAGDMTKTSEEQNITQALKTFTDINLAGVVIIDHWKDPSDGTYFALAKLDMANIRKSLDNAKELDAKVRDFVRANSDKAFDELNAEQAKRAGAPANQ